MTKRLVWFAPRYGNAGGWRECTVDRFGVWRGPGGMYMPAPSADRVKEA
jgi:hypothetical protein